MEHLKISYTPDDKAYQKPINDIGQSESEAEQKHKSVKVNRYMVATSENISGRSLIHANRTIRGN